MQKICRICLKTSIPSGLKHISHEITVGKSISQFINEFSPIQISEQDSLPQYVCLNCYEQLLFINSFRTLLIDSDSYLRHKLIENCTIIEIKVEKEIEKINNVNNAKRKPGRKPSSNLKHTKKIHEFKCNVCQKVLFGRSNRLEQHMVTSHSNIKNYSCHICPKKFKSKQQLVNHSRVHTGEKPYHCQICGESFATTQNLYNHKKKHTGIDKQYQCRMCEKAYLTPGELESHQRIIHTGEKPFLCEICSRTYSSLRYLGLHIKSVHEKTEKCFKCGLMFNIKRVQSHMQKHHNREAGIQRYTCDKCGKGFITPHTLKKHQLTHSGQRPFSCKTCHKSFTQKSAVDVHMKVHSNVRSFSCEQCAKTFKYKQHLKLHLKLKH
ncbi:hypothetical protein ABEB36_002021 [Hypothenemus hampei]|uniref:Uncharacterized protein n=1 Tax=Hypothenemus hampei TaxID=57062 RepID=A0ABD1FGH2_HYPHA